jgi:hypothetical protein
MTIDIVAVERQFEDLLAQVATQQLALQHYANADNWEHVEIEGVFVPGPAVDGGAQARKALGVES